MPETVDSRYELVREIGRGASATVYLAHDRTLDRDVALKLVAPALANDPSFVDRFLREARLSASLSHPNVVTVHDVGETEDGRPFLTMSLVNGASLETIIEESAPLPLGEVSRILTELGSALDYLHGKGLVHRDVKPSNVLVEQSGRVMLSDFGIAYARESARYTMTGVLLGTPRYMAPEQMLGEEPTPQTDVYAMGVVAFEMLAGAPPFEGTGTGLMYKIVHEPPPPVTSLAPDIPAGVEAAIVRALQKDPAARWETPGEFAAALASPEANATLVGAGLSRLPTVPPVPPGAVAAVEPQLMGEALPAPGSSGGSGRGWRRTTLGAGGLGVAGLAVASYCLAAGGANPPADGREEATPTFAATSTAPGALASSTTPSGASTTSTLAAASSTAQPSSAPQPTSPPPPPGATATATTANTNTPAPGATATATATSTVTPTPSPTPTRTPTATPTTAPPTAPSNVTLNGNTLSWSDNSNNESGFRIYWRARDINTGEIYMDNDKSVGPNVTTTPVDTIFLVATTTDFRRGVAAYNAAGESAIAWSQ